MVSPALELGGGPTATLAAVLQPSAQQRWLIAGTRTNVGDLPTATVWTSANGSTWTATALASSVIPSEAEAAAQYRDTTVVVGSVGSGSDRRAAVWLSAGPGEPWKLVSVERSDEMSYMSAATVGALGFFASGRIGSRLGLWSSTDGIHWTESTGAERAIDAAPSARVNSLLAEGTTVYAAGSVANGAVTAAAIWASGDGINWHSVRPQLGSFSATGDRMITSLAPLGDGLVAVGAVASGSSWLPASWISPNGVSWSQPSVHFSTPGSVPGAVVHAVTSVTTLAGTSDLYAVGGTSQRQYLWHSTDGLVWLPVALPPAAAVATAWQATLVATSQGTTIVADGDPGQPHVLTSVQGQWSEPSANPATFGAVQPFADPVATVATAGGVTVEVKVLTPSQTVGGYTAATAVVTSPNGATWSAGTPADLGSPPTLPVAGAVATPFAGGWVAVAPASGLTATSVGETPGAARSWTSSNGVSWTPGGQLNDNLAGNAVTPTTAGAGQTTTGATDRAAPVGQAVPSGLCISPSAVPTVIAVGSSSLATAGTGALAWTSRNGISWGSTQIQPAPTPSGVEEMVGCVAAGGVNMVAYGTSTPAGGGPEPTLWRSSNGGLWTRQTPTGFSPAAPYPIDRVAVHDSTWLATAGLPATPGPSVVSVPEMMTPGWGGPGAYRLPGPGAGSLLLSRDGGLTWAAIPTTGSPWSGTGVAAITSVVFAGVTPVVTGSVDGRLAIWMGTRAKPTS